MSRQSDKLGIDEDGLAIVRDVGITAHDPRIINDIGNLQISQENILV